MLCKIMKTTRNVLKSNYCKVLSQKCRQVFKPLAGVTLWALIVLFDVISHHEQRNPSYMINCAVFKTPSHLQHEPSEALYSTVFYWVRLRGTCLWKKPAGSLLPSKAGGLHDTAVSGMQGTWQYHTVVQLFVACVQLEPHFSLGS